MKRYSKVSVVGVGAVGSTIAYTLLFNRFKFILNLVDVNKNKLMGEYLDLIDANKIYGGKKIITKNSIENSDFIIITAGKRRAKKGGKWETDGKLYNRNLPIIKKIANCINKKCPSARIIIATNPPEEFANLFDGIVYPAGHLLDMMREGHDGKDIQKYKGYTNFGIALEVNSILIPLLDVEDMNRI